MTQGQLLKPDTSPCRQNPSPALSRSAPDPSVPGRSGAGAATVRASQESFVFPSPLARSAGCCSTAATGKQYEAGEGVLAAPPRIDPECGRTGANLFLLQLTVMGKIDSRLRGNDSGTTAKIGHFFSQTECARTDTPANKNTAPAALGLRIAAQGES